MSLPLPVDLGLAAFSITLGVRLAFRADRLLVLATSKFKSQPIPSTISVYLRPLFWFCLFVLGPALAILISGIALLVHGPAFWQAMLAVPALSLGFLGWRKMRH